MEAPMKRAIFARGGLSNHYYCFTDAAQQKEELKEKAEREGCSQCSERDACAAWVLLCGCAYNNKPSATTCAAWRKSAPSRICRRVGGGGLHNVTESC